MVNARIVGRRQFARKDARDLFCAVQRHVEQEIRSGQQCRFPRFFPDRVSLGNSPGGAPVHDHAGVMVAEDGALSGHAGHDRLATAGKTGEKMRLDEAGQNLDVGRKEIAVYPDFMAKGRATDTFLAGLVGGVILHDAISSDDVRAQHLLQFGAAVGPVSAKGIA